MSAPRGIAVLDGSHRYRWDVPDWIDPAGAYVYVAWSWRHPDEVLYVGVSTRILMRLAEHAAGSAWWSEAQHLDLYRYPDRQAAAKAEAEGIARFDPHYNGVRPGGAVHSDECAVCQRRDGSLVCWTCGAPPAGTFRDGSPRYACHHNRAVTA